jgi:hypothetical protein
MASFTAVADVKGRADFLKVFERQISSLTRLKRTMHEKYGEFGGR